MDSSRGSSHRHTKKNRILDANDEQEFTQLKSKEPASLTQPTQDEGGSTKPLILLLLIFLSALGVLGLVYLNFPQLAQDEKQYIKLPRDIEDAKNLGKVLSGYTDTYYYQPPVLCNTRLNILEYIVWCSGLGATFCYLLSLLVGRRLVIKYIPERVADWQAHVNHHREHLLNYIIFLRITPFLPNWFINIASPVINVPLLPFFLGTFLGVAPPSFVAIQGGTTLHQLTSSGDAVSYRSMGILAVFAVISLLPVIFKKKLKAKL
ncbi:TM41B-like protein, partial [Mya arenaria]